MRNLCIIPARGGSKRIPRKNIKEFMGKPIIAYAIELAIKSELFEEIMVSTDDEEIANIAISYGANVPFMRKENTANDFAITLDVLKEVVENYKNLDKHFDSICCIYPTAVLSNVKDLIAGFNLLEKNTIVFPVTNFSFPPMRSLLVDNNGMAEYQFPKYTNERSQDLESWYHDAGQWYWHHSGFFENKELNFQKKVIKLSNIQVQDIDNEEDWEIAELKYKIINKHV